MNIFGIKTFLTHKHYGQRPARHFDAYRMSEGWYFIEAGSWTLEIETPSMPRRLPTLRALLQFLVRTGRGT